MRPPKLYHYSRKPLSGVGDVKQGHLGVTLRGKACYPRGLWFAPEKTWPRFARFFLEEECFSHRHKVVLKPSANILSLATKDQCLEFSRKFGYGGYGVRVRWDLVAEEYDGIKIDFVPCFFDGSETYEACLWAEAWDVESGCVWKADAIEVYGRDARPLPYIPSYDHWMERESLRFDLLRVEQIFATEGLQA